MKELNEIIWTSVRGADSPIPTPVHRDRAVVEKGLFHPRQIEGLSQQREHSLSEPLVGVLQPDIAWPRALDVGSRGA